MVTVWVFVLWFAWAPGHGGFSETEWHMPPPDAYFFFSREDCERYRGDVMSYTVSSIKTATECAQIDFYTFDEIEGPTPGVLITVQ